MRLDEILFCSKNSPIYESECVPFSSSLVRSLIYANNDHIEGSGYKIALFCFKNRLKNVHSLSIYYAFSAEGNKKKKENSLRAENCQYIIMRT